MTGDVLVVDDEADIRDLVAAILEEAPAEAQPHATNWCCW